MGPAPLDTIGPAWYAGGADSHLNGDSTTARGARYDGPAPGE